VIKAVLGLVGPLSRAALTQNDIDLILPCCMAGAHLRSLTTTVSKNCPYSSLP
jgi:hypothetical protein